MKRIARFVAALIATVLISAAAQAEEAPALAQASGADKARLQELIATAVQEGQVAYIDTVIQPATNAPTSPAISNPATIQLAFVISTCLACVR